MSAAPIPFRVDEEVRELARETAAVVFDFDGVFTDNTVLVGSDGLEFVRCWRGDGLGLRALERIGVRSIILSTETDPVVGVRARKMRIPFRQGLAEKGAELKAFAAEAGVPLQRCAYVGNDTNDLSCFRLVGFPIAVADAHPCVDAHVRYRTRALGGRGAVREVCDLMEWAHDGRDVRS